MTKRWTDKDQRQLERLVKNENLLGSEIAERIGKKPGAVRYHMQKMGIDVKARAEKSGKLGQQNVKHKHLQRKVLVYFKTHSFNQTAKQFGLTHVELKSCLTKAYKNPDYTHLRKDFRRHDPWSFEEIMFLLKASGLQPRAWIAKKLKRGTMHAVKEVVKRLNANTRYMNGLPRQLAEELIGYEIKGFKVKAGPSSGRNLDFRPVIVPWVTLYSEARRSSRVPAHICDAIGAMAKFQKRIHGTRGIKDTLECIEKIIAKR